MITTDQRVLLVFIGLVLIIIMSINNLVKYSSFERRIGKFLQLLVLLFPILDLKLPPAELNIKLFEASIAAFSLLNFTYLLKLVKTFQNSFIWIFLGTMAFLALYSEFKGLSLLSVVRLGLVVLLLAYFRMVNEAGMNIFKTILLPIVLWAILFFSIQLAVGVQFTLYQSINESSLRDLRYTSFSQDPQKLAQIVFMLAIIFLADAFQKEKLTSLRHWCIILACILIGLSTGARAALLGFILAFIWMFLNKISLKSVLFVFTSFLIVVFSFEWISSLQTFQRMTDIDSAYEGRMQLFWVRGFIIFTENIWSGVGPGNFLSYISHHHNDFTYGADEAVVDQPESGFLLWLCETGIIGAILYLILIIKVLIHKTQQNNSKPFKLSIIIWIIGFITVYSLSDVKLLFLVVLSMAMVFSYNLKNQSF